MAIYGYTKNYKLIKPKYDTDTWHDYEYDNLDTIDAVLSAIYSSGNWQGFWKSNTHYNVEDIVIDRDTDTMYKVMVEHTTSAGSFAAEWTAHHNYYELWSPNDMAESWAIKTDGKVSDEDYSSKAYAISSGLIDDGSAKEWAVGSGAIGNTGEYSAKKYATDAHNDYISMTTNANVVAVASNINNVNAVGQSISSVNTVASNVSSVNTVAGVSTDVTAVAGIASSVPTVANNDANITTVATNISDVNTAATNIEAIKDAPNQANAASQSATNAANSATASANSATASATSASNSHIWAEGTDAQVAALGGVHSSKGWAEQSTSVNISLTNSPYTTNRILEIPQDIKLELNNGTLTLKAGSKTYKADGIVVIVPSDINYYFTGTIADNLILVYDSTVNSIGVYIQGVNAISSATVPSTGIADTLWFDTTSNKCKITHDNAATWAEIPLPIGVVSCNTTDGFTSIDQVFNGLGYIGSTVFALPGVKGQIPNGRNKDGTCESTLTTLTSVKTQTFTGAAHRGWYLQPNGASSGNSPVYSDTQPSQNYIRWFSQKDNQWYDTKSSPELNEKTYILPLAVFNTDSSGKITSFEPFTVDSVVNSNEFYQLKDKAVTTDTTQIISGSKRFTQPSAGMSIELIADTNQQTVPATTTLRQIGLYRNSTYTKGDGYTSWIYGARGSDGYYSTGICARRLLEGDNEEIMSYVTVYITPNGTPVAYTRTPLVGCVGEEIVTAGWVNSKMQVVSALPATPDANVFYFIPG